MKVIVTGAGGFVGSAVVDALARHGGHDITAVDITLDRALGSAAVDYVEGSIADSDVRARALATGCDALVHLATVPGGAAEENPELARQVNLDASIALIDEAAQKGRPKVVFASSIAVFGDADLAIVDHTTPIAPKLIYGAHKAMMEIWLGTKRRRGELDAVCLRFPGILARPRGRSGMKSAFQSEVFHAALAGESFVSPVSSAATVWITSCATAVENVLAALHGDILDTDDVPGVTLPAVRCTMAELVAEVAAHNETREFAVTYQPDAGMERGFGRWPALDSSRATSQGFRADRDLRSLVDSVINDIRSHGGIL